MCTHRIENKRPEMDLAQFAILGMAICAIAYVFSTGISGNDFWWHIKIGEWIIQNRTIPTTDIFSWYGTQQNISWTAHEWLSDVLLYAIHAITGDVGVFLMSLFASLLMMWLLWRETKKYIEKNVLIGGLYFVLFAVSTSVFFYGRPHLFSFFLLFWELKVLFTFMHNPKSKSLYWIPLLTCIWSNLHGGSASLSYVLCLVFLIVCFIKTDFGCITSHQISKGDCYRLLAVTIGSVLAILINPIGKDVLLYPYKSFSDHLQMTLISEWRSPDAKNIGDLLLFIFPIVLMLLGFFAENKHIRLIDLTIMGLFVFLFLRSVRFIMLWYIAAAFCAFPYMPECKVKPISPLLYRILVGVCSLGFLAIIGLCGYRTVNTVQKNDVISTALSDEAIQVIREDAPARIFNDYNLGEALIYNNISVFFDARADLYAQEGIMADGVSLMLLNQANEDAQISYVSVDSLLQKYEFDAILILKNRPLYAYIISHPEQFLRIYEDDSVGYFRVLQ